MNTFSENERAFHSILTLNTLQADTGTMVAAEHEEIHLDDLGLSLGEQVGHLLWGPRALCRGWHCQTECLSGRDDTAVLRASQIFARCWIFPSLVQFLSLVQ